MLKILNTAIRTTLLRTHLEAVELHTPVLEPSHAHQSQDLRIPLVYPHLLIPLVYPHQLIPLMYPHLLIPLVYLHLLTPLVYPHLLTPLMYPHLLTPLVYIHQAELRQVDTPLVDMPNRLEGTFPQEWLPLMEIQMFPALLVLHMATFYHVLHRGTDIKLALQAVLRNLPHIHPPYLRRLVLPLSRSRLIHRLVLLSQSQVHPPLSHLHLPGHLARIPLETSS